MKNQQTSSSGHKYKQALNRDNKSLTAKVPYHDCISIYVKTFFGTKEVESSNKL